MPAPRVSWMRSAFNRAVEHVNDGEEGGRAVAPVVVSDAFDVTEPHRKDRRGAFKGLDLAFLIDTKRHGLAGRVATIVASDTSVARW
jgi:hypothetical protein